MSTNNTTEVMNNRPYEDALDTYNMNFYVGTLEETRARHKEAYASAISKLPISSGTASGEESNLRVQFDETIAPLYYNEYENVAIAEFEGVLSAKISEFDKNPAMRTTKGTTLLWELRKEHNSFKNNIMNNREKDFALGSEAIRSTAITNLEKRIADILYSQSSDTAAVKDYEYGLNSKWHFNGWLPYFNDKSLYGIHSEVKTLVLSDIRKSYCGCKPLHNKCLYTAEQKIDDKFESIVSQNGTTKYFAKAGGIILGKVLYIFGRNYLWNRMKENANNAPAAPKDPDAVPADVNAGQGAPRALMSPGTVENLATVVEGVTLVNCLYNLGVALNRN